MINDHRIVSMMLCTSPVVIGGRAVISASDSVWQPIEKIPGGLEGLCDDAGNDNPSYAGTVFISSQKTFIEIRKAGLMICMRGVRAEDIHLTDCPLSISVTDLMPAPILMGWDVVRGNGWVSASCDGIYPINHTGELRNGENESTLNCYSLFDDLDTCLACCKLNNEEICQWAPWYPVAVYCDSETKRLIDELRVTKTTGDTH